PLDDAVARLERAIGTLEGRHPDYWHFLTETDAVRQTVARVVSQIREERGAGATGRRAPRRFRGAAPPGRWGRRRAGAAPRWRAGPRRWGRGRDTLWACLATSTAAGPAAAPSTCAVPWRSRPPPRPARRATPTRSSCCPPSRWAAPPPPRPRPPVVAGA